MRLYSNESSDDSMKQYRRMIVVCTERSSQLKLVARISKFFAALIITLKILTKLF